MIGPVHVEVYRASGDQQISCGHTIPAGSSLIVIRFAATNRELHLCPDCWHGVGHAATQAP